MPIDSSQDDYDDIKLPAMSPKLGNYEALDLPADNQQPESNNVKSFKNILTNNEFVTFFLKNANVIQIIITADDEL